MALDFRGAGASEITPSGTYGLDAHARDVLAAADKLGVDRFVLVSWSMGAMVTLHAAGLAPQRFGVMTDPEAIAAVRDFVADR